MQTKQVQAIPAEFSAEHTCSPKTAICEETTRICLEHYGKILRAVVLTGSLARDEATVVEDGDYCMLRGDADFFLVFHDKSCMPSFAAIESTSQEVKAALQQRRLIASVGLGSVDGSYFRQMPPHISTFELRSCGRVVWGDSEVLSLIPPFSAARISREDAWRMLANRIVELVGAVAPVARMDDLRPRDIQYRTIKLYLNMATSYLVFAGRYLPTYRERERALRQLLDEDPAQPEAPFPLRPFVERVSDCTKFKLDGHAELGTPERLWEEAVRDAHLLWRWELKRLTGATSDHSDSELMLAWMERQPLSVKIRGWASVLRRCGWHRSWRQWPRWIRLGLRASPRYWVYSVAADTLFRLPSLAGHTGQTECDNRWNFLERGLPLLEQTDTVFSMSPLERLACLTSVNYERFLEGTTS